jgi:exopolysaccharide biosynthesis protein
VLLLAAPFPAVSAQTLERAEIAPGIEFARYHLATAAGPLVVTALALDLTEPTLSLAPVLASDRLVSSGETLSSMALRTGAVAALNADFFDVGNTYAPIGIVATAGTLLRSPSARAALTLTKAGEVRIGAVPFTGTVRAGGESRPLRGVGILPQASEVTLVQLAYGALPAITGAQLVPLEALPGAPGSYRAGPAAGLGAPHDPAFGLIFGADAALAGLPAEGDEVQIDLATDPPLEQIALALGGGPQLVRDGAPFEDPDAPARDEANRRNPLSGALRTAAGKLVLVEVDGRDPLVSNGLRRLEFGALLQAFGAVDGMGFDGGGSSELLARLPGDRDPQILTVPSDGRERPISDALVAVSDAPAGAPARLAVQPLRLALLTGAHLHVKAVLTDAAGHPQGEDSGPLSAAPSSLVSLAPDGTLTAGDRAGSGTLHLSRGTIAADVPFEVVAAPAALRIEPAFPNPEPGGRTALRAVAVDASGFPLAVDGRVSWSAANGRIAPDGTHQAGRSDDLVKARIGGAEAALTIPVGRHDVALDVLGRAGGPGDPWRFSTVPANGPGSLANDAGALALAYDFTGDERAAIASASLALPGRPLELSVDIHGDGSGAGIRLAFTNGDRERVGATLVKRLDWIGWKRISLRLPPRATPPLSLAGITVINSLGTPPVHTSGVIALRDLRIVLAGTSP